MEDGEVRGLLIAFASTPQVCTLGPGATIYSESEMGGCVGKEWDVCMG